jgi:glycerophosphoryl diester phosphodiesterase
MTFDLLEAARERLLVVAHRGASGGNIPCNTLASFEIALKQGADMLEIDVERSLDGKLYVFHPGMESAHLCHAERISRMTSEEISKLRYVNFDRMGTQFPVNTFDEFLETFKGRCFVNVDKFWGHPEAIYETIKRHGMTEQMLVKSPPSEKVHRVLRELCPELPYMSVVCDVHPLHESLIKSGINYIGAEVLFEKEDAEVASPAFIERMHRDGKLVWVNAIIYDFHEQLSGGHSDDTALTVDPELGWGWLARRGFDLIQTDWTGMLIGYLREQDLLYK